jgi:hypothetical protein
VADNWVTEFFFLLTRIVAENTLIARATKP